MKGELSTQRLTYTIGSFGQKTPGRSSNGWHKFKRYDLTHWVAVRPFELAAVRYILRFVQWLTIFAAPD
jgi:hypothetical protein